MEKQNFVHDFQQKLLEMFRASPAADLERNVKALMGQTFNKLELVTRGEFEVQVELLRVLRERVDVLEKRLAEAPGAAASAYTGHYSTGQSSTGHYSTGQSSTGQSSSGQSSATQSSVDQSSGGQFGAGQYGADHSGSVDPLKEAGKQSGPYTNPSAS